MLVGKVSVSKLTIKQLCCFRFILGLKYWNLVITLTLILIDLVSICKSALPLFLLLYDEAHINFAKLFSRCLYSEDLCRCLNAD